MHIHNTSPSLHMRTHVDASVCTLYMHDIFTHEYIAKESVLLAVCCSVMQCVAVCCSVLQCVAVCCSVFQCVPVCCSVLPLCLLRSGTTHSCSVFQCAAVFLMGTVALYTTFLLMSILQILQKKVSYLQIAAYYLFYRALLQKRPHFYS